MKQLFCLLFLFQFTVIFSQQEDTSGRKFIRDKIKNIDFFIKQNPTNATNYFTRGGYKYALKDYSGANSDYDKAIMIRPGNANYYYNKGNCEYKLGDIKASIENYNTAIRLDPKELFSFTIKELLSTI